MHQRVLHAWSLWELDRKYFAPALTSSFGEQISSTPSRVLRCLPTYFKSSWHSTCPRCASWTAMHLLGVSLWLFAMISEYWHPRQRSASLRCRSGQASATLTPKSRRHFWIFKSPDTLWWVPRSVHPKPWASEWLIVSSRIRRMRKSIFNSLRKTSQKKQWTDLLSVRWSANCTGNQSKLVKTQLSHQATCSNYSMWRKNSHKHNKLLKLNFDDVSN